MSRVKIFAERSKEPLENITSDLGQETDSEVVWPYLKVFLLGKYNSTGNNTRKIRGRGKF